MKTFTFSLFLLQIISWNSQVSAWGASNFELNRNEPPWTTFCQSLSDPAVTAKCTDTDAFKKCIDIKRVEDCSVTNSQEFCTNRFGVPDCAGAVRDRCQSVARDECQHVLTKYNCRAIPDGPVTRHSCEDYNGNYTCRDHDETAQCFERWIEDECFDPLSRTTCLERKRREDCSDPMIKRACLDLYKTESCLDRQNELLDLFQSFSFFVPNTHKCRRLAPVDRSRCLADIERCREQGQQCEGNACSHDPSNQDPCRESFVRCKEITGPCYDEATRLYEHPCLNAPQNWTLERSLLPEGTDYTGYVLRRNTRNWRVNYGLIADNSGNIDVNCGIVLDNRGTIRVNYGIVASEHDNPGTVASEDFNPGQA